MFYKHSRSVFLYFSQISFVVFHLSTAFSKSLLKFALFGDDFCVRFFFPQPVNIINSNTNIETFISKKHTYKPNKYLFRVSTIVTWEKMTKITRLQGIGYNRTGQLNRQQIVRKSDRIRDIKILI